LAAQIAHAACREVSSVGARQFAASCASSSAGALSCFASRFSDRADMWSCATDDGKDGIKVYVVPEEHSHAVIIVVCVCHYPKVIGVLIFPPVEFQSMIASIPLTRLASSRTSCFAKLPASCVSQFHCVFLRSCHTHSLRPTFPREPHTYWPIYSARFCPQTDGMRASNAESLLAAFTSSRTELMNAMGSPFCLSSWCL
jgi:hypothetical protein